MPEFERVQTLDGTEIPVVDLDVDLGATGAVLQGGRFTDEEFNKALKPYKARGYMGDHGLYDKMRRTDATVNGVLLSQELPIRAAEWIVEPCDNPDERDLHIADFVADNLFNRIEAGWDSFLLHALLFLQFGFILFERVYERTPDGHHRLRKLAPRMPWSISKWVEDVEGNLVAITQRVKKGRAYENIVIPAQKCLLLVNRMEGGNYEGISAIRQAYGPWLKKDQIDRRDLINYERFGSGLPVFKEPPTFNAADPQWAADLDRIAEIGRNLRAHEKSYVQVPRGWEFTIEFPTGGGLPVGEKQRYYDHQILLNSLAMLMDLGHTETGSRALGETFSDLFLNALRGHAKVVEDALNGVNGLMFTGVIPELVDLNFGPQKRYPRVKATKLANKAINAQLTSISEAVEKGILTWGDKDETLLRDWLDLPTAAIGATTSTLSEPEDPATYVLQESEQEKAKAAQEARSKQYDIAILPSTHVTKPGKWERLKDAQFGDPVNYRYPMPDKAHIRNARARVAQEDGEYRGQGIVRKRIADAARKAGIGEEGKKSKGVPFRDGDGQEFYGHREPIDLAEKAVAWKTIDDEITMARDTLGEFVAPVVEDITDRFREEAIPLVEAIRSGIDMEENVELLQALHVPGLSALEEAVKEHQATIVEVSSVTTFRELHRQSVAQLRASESAGSVLLQDEEAVIVAGLGATLTALVAEVSTGIPVSQKVDLFMQAQRYLVARKIVSEQAAILKELAVKDALTATEFLPAYVPPSATSPKWRGAATSYANPTYDMARENGVDLWSARTGQSVQMVRYSALLDRRTCGPCASEDGRTVAFQSADYEAIKPPFIKCLGWSACRCMFVYEMAAMGPAVGVGELG